MRRFSGNIFDNDGFLIMNVQDVVTLLAQKREERFEGERAIRLFQFRTWMLFSDDDDDDMKYVKWAESIAAVKWLELMEEDYFAGE